MKNSILALAMITIVFSACESGIAPENIAKLYSEAYEVTLNNEPLPTDSANNFPMATTGYTVPYGNYYIDKKSIPNGEDVSVYENAGTKLYVMLFLPDGGELSTDDPDASYRGDTLVFDFTDKARSEYIRWEVGDAAGRQQLRMLAYIDLGNDIRGYFPGLDWSYFAEVEAPINNQSVNGFEFEPWVEGEKQSPRPVNPTGFENKRYWSSFINVDYADALCVNQNCFARLYTYTEAKAFLNDEMMAEGWRLPSIEDIRALDAGVIGEGNKLQHLGFVQHGMYGGTDFTSGTSYITDPEQYTNFGGYWAFWLESGGELVTIAQVAYNKELPSGSPAVASANIPADYRVSLIFVKDN